MVFLLLGKLQFFLQKTRECLIQLQLWSGIRINLRAEIPLSTALIEGLAMELVY